MIKINKELLSQIQRANLQDERYLIHLMRRVPAMIQDEILTLRHPELSDLEAYVKFLFFMENGIEKFSVKMDIPPNYLDEVERVNPDIHDFIILCSFTKLDRLTVLVLLFRIYESEHEVRSMP